MSYNYTLKYYAGNPVGKRSCIQEYYNGVPTIPEIFIENKGFTYGLSNPEHHGQHFYLECLPSQGTAKLYKADKLIVFGQHQYYKIGNPILTS